VEARHSSPTYERLALAVAGDPELLQLLGTVPAVRRQPNLLFGGLRWHDAPPAGSSRLGRPTCRPCAAATARACAARSQV